MSKNNNIQFEFTLNYDELITKFFNKIRKKKSKKDSKYKNAPIVNDTIDFKAVESTREGIVELRNSYDLDTFIDFNLDMLKVKIEQEEFEHNSKELKSFLLKQLEFYGEPYLVSSIDLRMAIIDQSYRLVLVVRCVSIPKNPAGITNTYISELVDEKLIDLPPPYFLLMVIIELYIYKYFSRGYSVQVFNQKKKEERRAI